MVPVLLGIIRKCMSSVSRIETWRLHSAGKFLALSFEFKVSPMTWKILESTVDTIPWKRVEARAEVISSFVEEMACLSKSARGRRTQSLRWWGLYVVQVAVDLKLMIIVFELNDGMAHTPMNRKISRHCPIVDLTLPYNRCSSNKYSSINSGRQLASPPWHRILRIHALGVQADNSHLSFWIGKDSQVSTWILFNTKHMFFRTGRFDARFLSTLKLYWMSSLSFATLTHIA